MSYLSQFKPRSMRNAGAYSASTIYFRNDVVTYNGNVYTCTVDGTENVLPTNASNWSGTVVLPTLTVANTGTGTNAANLTISLTGNTLTLNHG